MKTKKVLILLISVSLLILIATGIIAKINSNKEKVSLDVVRKDKLTKVASITGEVISSNSFETLLNPSLKITSIKFNEGDTVNKGDVILSYDSSEIDAQLEKARLNLSYQKEILASANSKETEEIPKNLPSQVTDNLSNEEIKEILSSTNKVPEVNIKAQKLQVDVAQNDVNSLEKKLSSFKVISPISGKINKLDASKGSIPAQGAMLQINDISKLKIRLSLSQYDSALIKKGQKVSISISGINNPLSGEVTYVSDIAEPLNPTSTEKSIVADVSINEDSSNIKIGFEADCSITIAEKKATYISFDSIKKDKSGTYVYVVVDNKVQKKQIKTGLETDFEIEVIEGLKEGDRYIKNPSETLKEGSLIKITNPKEGINE